MVSINLTNVAQAIFDDVQRALSGVTGRVRLGFRSPSDHYSSSSHTSSSSSSAQPAAPPAWRVSTSGNLQGPLLVRKRRSLLGFKQWMNRCVCRACGCACSCRAAHDRSGVGIRACVCASLCVYVCVCCRYFVLDLELRVLLRYHSAEEASGALAAQPRSLSLDKIWCARVLALVTTGVVVQHVLCRALLCSAVLCCALLWCAILC
jgi:hypothetical protein